MRKWAASAVCMGFLLAALFAAPAHGAKGDPAKVKDPGAAETNIQREVRHNLVTLSRYTVFDNITYAVEGTRVILMGQVNLPVLKDDAEQAVKEIEGVTEVQNQIEVLPLSPMDNGIRRAVYRAIYGDTDLSRYALQAVPSIHIIVKNGNVTLEGAVASEMDKSVAGIRANAVGGVFSVTNHLLVDTYVG